MTKLLHHLGLYFIMMNKVISKPENWSIFRKQLALEMEKVGLNSVSLVIILSFFVDQPAGFPEDPFSTMIH